MSDTNPPDDTLLEDISSLTVKLWCRLIGKDRYVEAVLVSLINHLDAHQSGKEEAKKAAAWMVVDAAKNLQKQIQGEDVPPGEKAIACSFCGKPYPEVKVIAGPDVFICYECVVLTTEIMRHEQGQAAPPVDKPE